MLCPLQHFCAPQSGSVDMGTAFRQRCVLEPGPGPEAVSRLRPHCPNSQGNCTHILHETER